MAVKVDESTCIGCGICEGIYPDLFEMEGGIALVKELANYDTELAGDAIAECPVAAITDEPT